MREAMFYEKLNENFVKCHLCPHNCIISEEHKGKCLVRENRHGVLYSMNYSLLSSIAIDPIEKKPLHKFEPGSQILSIGSYGCNMSCKFCQNFTISREFESKQKKQATRVKPYQIIAEAQYNKLESIAYTYNEPTVFYEMVLDTAILAKKAGIKNVLVTNGFINEEPFLLLAPYIDAMNVDIKCYDSGKYRSFCRGDLEPVLSTIKTAIANQIHVEITLLIVPEFNDDLHKYDSFFALLKQQLGEVYIHISRYFPNYMYDKDATSIDFMMKIKAIGLNYFKEIALGNVR